MQAVLFDEELLNLYDLLIKSIVKNKIIKKDYDEKKILFNIYNLTKNRKSQIFSSSSKYLNDEISNYLLNKRYVQKISNIGNEKYSLTFNGIAYCINLKYKKSFEEQFLNFLDLSDLEFTRVIDPSPLNWKEKIATVTLLLMACTSENSALRLNNVSNKETLEEVFLKVINCFKKHKLIIDKAILKSPSRGESRSSALMSRLNALPRKTNHIYKYITKESGYYLDIQKNGDIDNKKLNFLLKKIFEKYYDNKNYNMIKDELIDINQKYYTRFLNRNINQKLIYNIIKNFSSFFEREIWRL